MTDDTAVGKRDWAELWLTLKQDFDLLSDDLQEVETQLNLALAALKAVVAVADAGPHVLEELKLMPKKLQQARLQAHNSESDRATGMARAVIASIESSRAEEETA